METWTDTLRYKGFKCAPIRCEFGWYRGRNAFRPNVWDEGLFYFLLFRIKILLSIIQVKEFTI